jgi:hypothetical protein
MLAVYLNFGLGRKSPTVVSYHLVLSTVGFDINALLNEARGRWLKPSEVYYILLSHEKLKITHEPPNKPSSIAHLLNLENFSFTSVFTLGIITVSFVL